MELPQISIFLENKPGQLCAVTDILAKAGINLEAINIAESTDYGVLRLITSDSEKAKQLLDEKKYLTRIDNVMSLEINDEVGGLGKELARLSEEGIDIEYMYSVFGGKEGKALLVIKPKKKG